MKADQQRIFCFACLFLGTLAGWVVLSKSARENDHPGSMSGRRQKEHAHAPAAVVSTNTERTSDVKAGTLTGQTAMEALRKSGQYASLAEAFSAARHAVEKIDPAAPHSRGAEYFAANPGQQLRAWFSRDGVELASGVPTPGDQEPWTVALRLRALGRGAKWEPVSAQTASAAGSRVEAVDPQRGVTQWFENRNNGLEHGFTLSGRPEGEAREVAIQMDLGGTLRAEPIQEQEGKGLRFIEDNGLEVLRYTGLRAWDANHRDLPAHMEVRGTALILSVADAGALYPVTIDPLFANVEARLAEESQEGRQFGSSVAVLGNTAVVGDPNYDSTRPGRGRAYVFVRTRDAAFGTLWTLEAKLTPTDGTAGDQCGSSVGLGPDTALIGAPGAGAAYIFVRSGTLWTQQAKLSGTDSASGNYFGGAVALNGETALVTASRDNTAAGSATGSAYVFVRNGSVWNQQAKLLADDASSFLYLGTAVSLSGDTALLSTGTLSTPSAYVFVRNGAVWTQQAKLTALGGSFETYFGISVAVFGDTALIGAPRDRVADVYQGSAYVFLRSGTTWSLQTRLTASDGAYDQQFGTSVALQGDRALVASAPFPGGGDSVYILERSGTVWSEKTKFTPAPQEMLGINVALDGNVAVVGASALKRAYFFAGSETGWDQDGPPVSVGNSSTGDSLGASIALDGNTALIAAPRDSTVRSYGSAFVFVRDQSLWTLQAKLGGSDVFEQVGVSVALEGNTALVGAYADFIDFGSVYVFVRNGAVWSLQTKLTGSAGPMDIRFGTSVALSGDTALVGNPNITTFERPGLAYVFGRDGAVWREQAKLIASLGTDSFGRSVALSGNTAVVGAQAEDSNMGAAHVFVRKGTLWNEQTRLTASERAERDLFGASVAVFGDTILIGAPQPLKSTETNGTAGAAYVFERVGEVWSQQAKLTASDGQREDQFGSSVALFGNIAVIGAPHDDSVVGPDAGSAYVFVMERSLWTQQLKLTSGVDASAADLFGQSVAVRGDLVLVGASEDETSGPGAGAAYAFLLGALPEIILQPVSRTIPLTTPGPSVTLSVIATGYEPLQYQWRKNGNPMPGASGTLSNGASSFTIPAVTETDAGLYDVVIWNVGGTVTSSPATLSVNALSQFTQAFPGVPPTASGFVLVNVVPPISGAGWRFVGEKQWQAPGLPLAGLTLVEREIEFRPVPGYNYPPRETVVLTTEAPFASLERTYYVRPAAGSGGLSVTLKPDSIVLQAKWRFLGEDDTKWRDSGYTETGLVAGSYLVECKPVGNLVTPPPLTVVVGQDETPAVALTYGEPDAEVGVLAQLVPFETASTSTNLPYGYVGQIRSDAGLASGFVVKPRVVATAGHVVFNDVFSNGAPSYVTGLQWLLQRDHGIYDPKPQIPRGFYTFDGYAAARQEPGVVPGEGTAKSQHFDVAALYFLEEAGRGGFSGFLASDAIDNEFLLSDANKILVGYPIDRVDPSRQGRMHATPALNVAFERVPGQVAPGIPFRTYTTDQIRSTGGSSGGPLCVQFEGGNYYPAAIYLGGSGQTVVRAIDSEVIELFNRAQTSANGGGNNTSGGITHTEVTVFGAPTVPGALKVIIEPAAARAANAGWLLVPETTYRRSDSQRADLTPGTYTLAFRTVDGFPVPPQTNVVVDGGSLKTITFTYGSLELENWRMAHFGTTENSGLAADDADPDGDGSSNINEFIAGTEPNDRNDVFRISVTRTNNSVTVMARGTANRSYELQLSDRPFGGSWINKASISALSANASITLIDPAPPATSAFYRLRVSKQ